MKKIIFIAIFTILISLSFTANAASSNDIKASVQIVSYDINSSFATGTGFFISSMGTVLTNLDVIWDSNTNAPREDITIFTMETENGVPTATYTMEVWTYDSDYNLALLSPKYPIDDMGFATDEYIGFNNSLNTPYLDFEEYTIVVGDALDYIAFDDTTLSSGPTTHSTAVVSYDAREITVSDSTTLMSSGGPIFYGNDAVGLNLEGTGVVRSDTIYDWFMELTTDFTLTQPFVDVTFSGWDPSSVVEPDPGTDPEPTTDPITPSTGDDTDYSDLPQEAQDFIASIQEFVRDGQTEMGGEMMFWDDLNAKEQSLYPSDVVNPLLYSYMDVEGAGVLEFPDVGTDHMNSDAIMGLANMGIINGYPDGTFKPDGNINRAELTKMVTLMRVVTVPQVEDYNNCFPDVASEWFAPYVCYAESVGWIDGYPDGTFKPAQNVNRAEALKIILNSWFYETGEIPSIGDVGMPVDADAGEWYYEFLNYAIQDDIVDLQHATYTDGFRYYVGGEMSRKEVAETIARLLVQ